MHLKVSYKQEKWKCPPFFSAVKESGAVHVTLEKRHNGAIVKRAANCEGSQHNKAKCHKETQTATLLITAGAMILEEERDTCF